MTSRLKKEVQKHIVTYGNYGFASAVGNPPLATLAGKRVIYNVSPGQLVAYVKEAGGVTRIVDTAGLDASEIHELYVGVGIDETGQGLTTNIRHLGIEHISGCAPQAVSTSSPRCGSPMVVDFYFECTKCNETYSVEVEVDDNFSRSFGVWNKSFQQFVGSVVTECSSCDDCPVEHNCKEVACKLADALNADIDLKVGDIPYPDWKGGPGIHRPYFATRLHPTSKIYCFGPQSEAESCTSCTYVAAVKGVKIRDTRYNFVGNLNPNDSTQTLMAQLPILVDQINEFFKTEYGEYAHAGSAYSTGSYSDCCPVQIHINTCDADFQLYDVNDNNITPQSTVNPFTQYGTVTPEAACSDCDDLSVAAKGTLTFTGQPLDTETVVINGKTYTFQDTLTNVNGNVKIGATVNDSINNLVAAINLGSGAGTKYATAMTVHATVTAANGAGDTVIVTAKTAGVAGNAYGTTETLTNGAFGAATLSGGVDSAATTPITYDCGIRVIAERIKGDCSCTIDNPLAFYGRTLKINPIGEGFRGKPWRVVTVQEMELPAGFGNLIQYLEYQQEPGGRGRLYNRSNNQRGTFNKPQKDSRINAVTAKCDENYCSYYLKSEVDVKHLTDKRGYLTIHSNVHIPSNDSTTIAAWEAFETALLALNPQCKQITSVACDTDLGSCS